MEDAFHMPYATQNNAVFAMGISKCYDSVSCIVFVSMPDISSAMAKELTEGRRYEDVAFSRFLPLPSIFDLVWNKLVATVWTTEPKNGKLVIERMHKFWHEILDPKYLMRTCFVALGRLRRLVGSGAIFPSLLLKARETRSRGMKENPALKENTDPLLPPRVDLDAVVNLTLSREPF